MESAGKMKNLLTKEQQLIWDNVAEQFPKKHPFKKLINAIRRNRFNWERYTTRATWYGLEIQTQRVVCSYGTIGYEVYIYGGSGHFATITYDWEKEDVTVNEW